MSNPIFRNNWIRVPLFDAALWVGAELLFNFFNPYPVSIWFLILWGLVLGFSLQTFNWLRVRNKYGNVDQQVSDARQKRSLTLMQNKAAALDTCRQAIESLPTLKLGKIDSGASTIRLRSKIRWVSWGFTWGNLISIKLHEVGDHLTEIQIEAKPLLPTVLLDSGQTWDTLERLVAEIKKSDSQPNSAQLNDGAEMLRDLTSRPVNFSR
jgi:hypothetical protein